MYFHTSGSGSVLLSHNEISLSPSPSCCQTVANEEWNHHVYLCRCRTPVFKPVDYTSITLFYLLSFFLLSNSCTSHHCFPSLVIYSHSFAPLRRSFSTFPRDFSRLSLDMQLAYCHICNHVVGGHFQTLSIVFVPLRLSGGEICPRIEKEYCQHIREELRSITGIFSLTEVLCGCRNVVHLFQYFNLQLSPPRRSCFHPHLFVCLFVSRIIPKLLNRFS